jgi:hypothetical protein
MVVSWAGNPLLALCTTPWHGARAARQSLCAPRIKPRARRA